MSLEDDKKHLTPELRDRFEALGERGVFQVYGNAAGDSSESAAHRAWLAGRREARARRQETERAGEDARRHHEVLMWTVVGVILAAIAAITGVIAVWPTLLDIMKDW